MRLSAFTMTGMLLVGGVLAGVSAQPVAVAQLEAVGTNTVSLGKIPCYEVKSVPFRLKNFGKSPITILSLRRTCTCVVAEKDKRLVQPGEEAVVTLHIDPANISGPFQRGAWVGTVDQDRNRGLLQLMIEGEAIPLFKGQPRTRVYFSAPKVVGAWTNSFAMEATEAGVRLGQPVFETNENLRVALLLTTNRTEKSSYQATLLVTPLAPGRHLTTVTLPVEGKTNLPPVTIELLAAVGQELSAVPDQLLLRSSETPLTRRVLISTQEEIANPKELTWELPDEGCGVEIKPASRTANLMIDLTFTPDALRRLLSKKAPLLTFRYPNYEPAVVRLLSADGEKPVPETSLSNAMPALSVAPQFRAHHQISNSH